MTLKRVAMEFGMGTDLHGMDYTKAAVRALKDALWHNSLSIPTAGGNKIKNEPDMVDKGQVAAVLPYGSATVIVEQGGLDIENDSGDTTVMANAAAVVYFDIAEGA